MESVVKVDAGDEEGVGSLGRYVWKSQLPYRLEFEMRLSLIHI